MTDAPDLSPLARLRASPAAPGLILGLFSLATALILATSDMVTKAPIALRGAEDLQASLTQVIPAELHDNDVAGSRRVIQDAVEGPIDVFAAAEGTQITGVAFELTGYGYGGAIRVLIGIAPDGTILGVRVLSHAETPGLGDKIELAKDDWITRFSGRSMTDPTPDRWKVRRDGGAFDQFSGATITPRAVVGTVYRGLGLFDRHRSALLAPLSSEDQD